MTTGSPASTTVRRPKWRSRLAVLLVSGAAITGLATTVVALSASASPAATAQPAAAAAPSPAVLSGTYTLHYSWGCTGHYMDAPQAFNANGTISFMGFVVGNWVHENGTVLWDYTGGPAKYAGNISGPVATGVMSSLTGSTGSSGCWYMTAAGVTGTPQPPAHHQHGLDAAGNPS